MKKYKIAVVEDEIGIAELIAEELTKQGYQVFCAPDGLTAEKLFATEKNLDLVILDINLPYKDGFTLVKELRLTSRVPVLMLSARDSEFDKIIGLEHGADDYLTKPFSVLELVARVKAMLRRNDDYRQAEAQVPTKKIFDFTLLPEEFAIEKAGQLIQLSNKEYKLLETLAENPKKVFTKYQLYQKVWDEEFLNDDNVVNVTVRRLRKKIEADPSQPKYILTVWGLGYKLGSEA